MAQPAQLAAAMEDAVNQRRSGRAVKVVNLKLERLWNGWPGDDAGKYVDISCREFEWRDEDRFSTRDVDVK